MVGNKIVATIRSDGKVYSMESDGGVSGGGIFTGNHGQFSNLNMKLRANCENIEANMNETPDVIISNSRIQASVMDLGKKLLQCARENDICGVEAMMRKGAPIASDWLGMTAIHFAAMNDLYDICKLLVSSGVNRDARTKVDRTPLHLAAYYGHERIAQLLIDNQCALNPRDMLRMTPLHWAVEKRHKGIVRLLLKHNADVTAVSKFGKTPIALAVLTEQADILQELEAAKQVQQSKKFSEQHEKETNEAVNSIMGQSKDDDEPQLKRQKFTSEHEKPIKTEIRHSVEDLDNMQDMKPFDNPAVNLLKSHGISIMKDDEDTSNNLLTTALQNGRQLVLSEGGKLLLNETRRLGLNKIPEIVKTSPTTQSAALTRFEPEPAAQLQVTNRFRPNIVSKLKDGTTRQLGTVNIVPNNNNNNDKKLKNVRIISLNDFKKIYTNGNFKKFEAVPNKLQSGDRRVIVQRKPVEASKPVIVSQPEDHENLDDDEENDLPPNIVKVSPESDQEDSSDIEVQQVQYGTPNAQQRLLPMRFTRTINSTRSTQTRPPIVTLNADVKNERTPVIPLLTMPEICRQLLELRKQNDELRRKYEIVQKEKEDIRNRLERLETLLLVEQTDEEYSQN